MSLILEALRKSEAERRRGQAPGLFVEQVRVPVRRREGTPAWAWALMLLLAGVLLAWGWREFRGRAPASEESAAIVSSDGSDTSRSIAQTSEPASGNSQRMVGADASSDAAARTTDSANEPAAVTAAGEDARGFDAYPARGASTAEAPSSRDDATLASGAQIVATSPQDTSAPTSASMGSATREPGAVPANSAAANHGPGIASTNTGAAHREPGDTPANTGIAESTSAAPPAPATTPANPSPAAASSLPPAPAAEDEYVPRLSELSGDERSGLPALKLSMHVYADDPTQRFVIVDGRRLREGDSPAAGIAVEAIRRDGLVLSVNGRRVLLARP
jgi:general secretion pathway protein B